MWSPEKICACAERKIKFTELFLFTLINLKQIQPWKFAHLLVKHVPFFHFLYFRFNHEYLRRKNFIKMSTIFAKSVFFCERKRRWRTTSGLPLSPWQESAPGAVAQIISFSYSVFLKRLVYSLFKMNTSTGTNFQRARICAHFYVKHLFFFNVFVFSF